MTTNYDPDAYWEARGGAAYRDYTNSPGYRIYREAQDQFFARLISEHKPTRLLDFACGTGKLFPHWVNVPEVHGYDRAVSQIEIAREEAARVRPDDPYHLMHCLMDERCEVPYDDDYFDMVVAAEVFLHVVPDDITPLLSELQRICAGHLVVVTAAPFDNPASHCFDHDYPALCQGRFDLIEDATQNRQRFFVGRKCCIGTSKETDHAVVQT